MVGRRLWLFCSLVEFPTELFGQLLDAFQAIAQVFGYHTFIGLLNRRGDFSGQLGQFVRIALDPRDIDRRLILAIGTC